MKKTLLIITFMLFGIFGSISAQTYTYKTTGFSMKQLTSYGWTDWSAWERSDMYMVINFDKDIVKIYSPEPQIYHILNYLGNYTDESGGRQIKFNFIDQDNDRGTMRLRIERNGNSQVYIDFNNVMWVYNVVRINN